MSKMTMGYASVSACGAYVMLMDYCEKIAIVGAVLRQENEIQEIELLVIPKNMDDFKRYLSREFNILSVNEMEITFLHRGEKITLTFATNESWDATHKSMIGEAT